MKSNEFFNEIYDSTHKKTLAVITAKCCNASDISDIFQETYCELFAVLKKHSSSYIENPEAFVMKLAKRKLAKYYTRLERTKAVLSLSASENEDGEPDLLNLTPDDFSIEDSVVDSELLRQIHDCIVQKDELTKKVFYLFYTLELTIPEIAALLEVSESAVKNKLYRTLKQLRVQYHEKVGE